MKFIIKRIKIILLFVSISLAVCSETLLESEHKNANSNTINISEGDMKHRKSMVKSLKNNLYSTTQSNSSPAISTKRHLIGGDAASRSPIVYTSWVKYFKYDITEISKETPKHFFSNEQFFQQKKLFPKADLKLMSSDGTTKLNTFIKSAFHFYVVLFKSNINFVSSRQPQYQKTIDVLNIDYIRPIEESAGFVKKGTNSMNGIQDFGNFSEGYCFKILVTRPKIETWVLCCEKSEDKNKFMTLIKNAKIKSQRDEGLVNVPVKRKETLSGLGKAAGCSEDGSSIDGSSKSGKAGSHSETGVNESDGYWVVLQDWSQCNVKCGGGTSTYQRMCHPPRNGGKACFGKSILTRECNKQKCPTIEESFDIGSLSSIDGINGMDINGHTINGHSSHNKTIIKTITLKPIIKILPFSCKKQRYSKCVIKESDLMLSQDKDIGDENVNPYMVSSKKSLPKLQIPTRVVMNSRTVEIFSGDSYDSLIVTFILASTIFKKSIKHPDCFYLLENEKKKAELCPFGFDSSGKIMREEWDHDFNQFKHDCFTPRNKLNSDSKLEADLARRLDQKIKDAKQQLADERLDAVKQAAASQEESKLENDVKLTNSVALQAITKELNLEEMIRKEEEAREKREEVEMLKKIAFEKKKSDCLMKVIKEKQIESQYSLKAKEAEDKINSIKQSATQQVLIKRNQLKDQIKKMRDKARRKTAEYNQQIQTVRFTMAQTMGKVYKKGDADKCKNAIVSSKSRNNYCQSNMIDDFNALTNCREGDDFCITCCDFEFGEMFINERQSCYKQTCPIKQLDTDLSASIQKGRWIWQNAVAR